MKKVIYIGGTAHCGSTILDIMLGESKKVFSSGQLGVLFKLLESGRRCTCGKTITSCPVWSNIIKGLTKKEQQTLFENRTSIWGERNIIRFIMEPKYAQIYANAEDTILREIFRFSNAELLVDSTNNISRALALLRFSRYTVYFLHLIRDVRGYVNSVNKRQMERKEPLQFTYSMIKWLSKNTTASSIARAFAGRYYIKITYEDLLLHPTKTIERIGHLIGHDFTATLSRIKEQQPFTQKHLFSANRVAQSDSIIFDPSRINSNKLKNTNAIKFWFLGGGLSSLWGYSRKQDYLLND